MNIFEYPLYISTSIGIEMPRGAKILSVQDQNGQLCIWAMVDPDQEFDKRIFDIHGTGNSLPDDPGQFIATVQQGPFVWHIFETTPPPC